ncbi:hypothetical protein [Methylococcus capsulatus]|uniref:hypothetical protein n=1 Tax=Methylococcus capsulatus TaxID=414 RepID=UPI00055B7788|nr:hypothetical protein [Methylococcus capsulatus]
MYIPSWLPLPAIPGRCGVFYPGTLLSLPGFGVSASLLSRHVMHTLVQISAALVTVMGPGMTGSG